jgi:hypothetical protein
MEAFWQAYGNWILYAAFFILMLGHHLFMGHGGHGDAADRDGHTHGADATRVP